MAKPTRFYSKKQENKVAKELGAHRVVNSGATLFAKGDVRGEDILIECKTLTKPQATRTIEKEWFTKNEEEAFAMGKHTSAVVFDFGDGQNYVAVKMLDFKLMYAAYLRECGKIDDEE